MNGRRKFMWKLDTKLPFCVFLFLQGFVRVSIYVAYYVPAFWLDYQVHGRMLAIVELPVKNCDLRCCQALSLSCRKLGNYKCYIIHFAASTLYYNSALVWIWLSEYQQA